MSNRPKVKVVLDTNVLLVSISSKSKYHWIFEKLLNQEFDIFITTEILAEYEEVISEKFNKEVAKSVIRTLLLLPNVYHTIIYYKWNLIEKDEDDNKFADCALASNSDCIVTNDNHFKILREIDFPKISVVNTEEFRKMIGKK
jgi:putative PIN family toxin of toxin-antitoxin system